MIALSKTSYQEKHPDQVAVFNANVVLSPRVKVWHGDINLSADEPLLHELARLTGRIVYLLYEGDGRFDKEDAPEIDNAVFSVTPTGHTHFPPKHIERATEGTLRARRRRRKTPRRAPAFPEAKTASLADPAADDRDVPNPEVTMQKARLFATIHPFYDRGDVTADLDEFANDVVRTRDVLNGLKEAGWEICFDGFDDGIAEFAAEGVFATVNEALAAAENAGASGHMLEWNPEEEYWEVGVDWNDRSEEEH
jgi:hypothetical protein